LRILKFRDLVLQRLHVATEATDFLVGTFVGSRQYRRQDRGSEIQTQPPTRGRPSQGERANDARTQRDTDKCPEPHSRLALLFALNSEGVLSELVVERVEPWHLCHVKCAQHYPAQARAMISR